VYLTWANPVFLAFFSFNGINNLRIFSVAFGSIPTAQLGGQVITGRVVPTGRNLRGMKIDEEQPHRLLIARGVGDLFSYSVKPETLD
jgi:hypothetical protein